VLTTTDAATATDEQEMSKIVAKALKGPKKQGPVRKCAVVNALPFTGGNYLFSILGNKGEAEKNKNATISP